MKRSGPPLGNPSLLACDFDRRSDASSGNAGGRREEIERKVTRLATWYVAILQEPRKVADVIIDAATHSFDK